MSRRLIVVGGGVRSGKSRFAIERALDYSGTRVFLATAQAYDDEMRRRVEAHRLERGGVFTTHEVHLDLARALRDVASADVVVIDCLTLYISNLLLAASSQDPETDVSLVKPELELQVAGKIEDVVAALDEVSGTVIIVTNEVGMGVVPVSALGRCFRDLQGIANQAIAARADELYLAALGVVLRLKPAPVVVLNLKP